MSACDGWRVKDRQAKVQKRRKAMPVNGRALKRLLVDRAAKAKSEAKSDRRR